MTLKEIYISECERKIKNKELYIPVSDVSSYYELEHYCKNAEFISNEFELLHGNIMLSKTPVSKREKHRIELSNNNFINIIAEKYPNCCSCRKESEITFRHALQMLWFYLLIDTAVVFLDGIDFLKINEILNDYLKNDIKNARTTQTEVIHLLTDFLCKYKLYKTAEKENFTNPSPETDFFNGNDLLSSLLKEELPIFH